MKALKNVRFTRKTAVLVIIMAAVLRSPRWCLLCSGGGGMETTEERTGLSGLAPAGRLDAASETGRDVVLPERARRRCGCNITSCKTQQGFDLEPWLGRECKSWSYTITNYPSGEQGVIAQIFVCGGEVIAGDIHSAKLGGFMHSLK